MLGVFQKLVHLLALTPVVVIADVKSNVTTSMLKTTRKLTSNFHTLQNPNQDQDEDDNENESSSNFKRIPSSFEYNDDGFTHIQTPNRNTTMKIMQMNIEDWDSQQESTLQNTMSDFPSKSSRSFVQVDGDSVSELRTGVTFLLMLPLAILEFVLMVLGILISIIVLLFVPALIGLVVYGAGAGFGYWDFFGYKIEMKEEKTGFMTHEPISISVPILWQQQRQQLRPVFQGPRENFTMKI